MKDNLKKIYSDLNDQQRVAIGFGLLAKGDYQELERFQSTLPVLHYKGTSVDYHNDLRRVFTNSHIWGFTFLRLVCAQTAVSYEIDLNILASNKFQDDLDKYNEMSDKLRLNMGGLFKAGREYCDQIGILFEDFVKISIHEDIGNIEPSEFNNGGCK